MLIIAILGLLPAVLCASGLLRFQGTLFPIFYFSIGKPARFEDNPVGDRLVNTVCGLMLGAILGTIFAAGIGLISPRHYVVTEEVRLVPIRHGSNTFYIGIGKERNVYSFLKETDANGGMVLDSITDAHPVYLYEDSPSGGKLVRIESVLQSRNSPGCNLFACSFTNDGLRYEFHTPPNSVGIF